MTSHADINRKFSLLDRFFIRIDESLRAITQHGTLDVSDNSECISR